MQRLPSTKSPIMHLSCYCHLTASYSSVLALISFIFELQHVCILLFGGGGVSRQEAVNMLHCGKCRIHYFGTLFTRGIKSQDIWASVALFYLFSALTLQRCNSQSLEYPFKSWGNQMRWKSSNLDTQNISTNSHLWNPSRKTWKIINNAEIYTPVKSNLYFACVACKQLSCQSRWGVHSQQIFSRTTWINLV